MSKVVFTAFTGCHPIDSLGSSDCGKRSALQVCGGQSHSWTTARRVHLLVLGQFQKFRAQCVQDRQGECEVKSASIDAVYQDALRHVDAVRFELERQVRIGHVSAFTQFFNQRFSPRLVKLTGSHFSQSCIEIHARILKSIKDFQIYASKLTHLFNCRPFTAGQVGILGKF